MLATARSDAPTTIGACVYVQPCWGVHTDAGEFAPRISRSLLFHPDRWAPLRASGHLSERFYDRLGAVFQQLSADYATLAAQRTERQ